MKRIRKKFIQVDPEFDCIETVYGMGYRWNLSNEELAAAESEQKQQIQ